MHCKSLSISGSILLSSLYLGSIYVNISSLNFLNKKDAFKNNLLYVNLALFGLSGLALMPLTLVTFVSIE